MSEYFCSNCGIRTKDNTHNGASGDHILSCPQCNFVMRFYILPSGQLKTFTEVHKEFVNTQLTEYQKWGSKAKRKRKND